MLSAAARRPPGGQGAKRSGATRMMLNHVRAQSELNKRQSERQQALLREKWRRRGGERTSVYRRVATILICPSVLLLSSGGVFTLASWWPAFGQGTIFYKMPYRKIFSIVGPTLLFAGVMAGIVVYVFYNKITYDDSTPRNLKLARMRIRYKKAKAEKAQQGLSNSQNQNSTEEIPASPLSNISGSSGTGISNILLSRLKRIRLRYSKSRDQECQTTFSFDPFEDAGNFGTSCSHGNNFDNGCIRPPADNNRNGESLDLIKPQRPKSYELSILEKPYIEDGDLHSGDYHVDPADIIALLGRMTGSEEREVDPHNRVERQFERSHSEDYYDKRSATTLNNEQNMKCSPEQLPLPYKGPHQEQPNRCPSPLGSSSKPQRPQNFSRNPCTTNSPQTKRLVSSSDQKQTPQVNKLLTSSPLFARQKPSDRIKVSSSSPGRVINSDKFIYPLPDNLTVPDGEILDGNVTKVHLDRLGDMLENVLGGVFEYKARKYPKCDPVPLHAEDEKGYMGVIRIPRSPRTASAAGEVPSGVPRTTSSSNVKASTSCPAVSDLLRQDPQEQLHKGISVQVLQEEDSYESPARTPPAKRPNGKITSSNSKQCRPSQTSTQGPFPGEPDSSVIQRKILSHFSCPGGFQKEEGHESLGLETGRNSLPETCGDTLLNRPNFYLGDEDGTDPLFNFSEVEGRRPPVGSSTVVSATHNGGVTTKVFKHSKLSPTNLPQKAVIRQGSFPSKVTTV